MGNRHPAPQKMQDESTQADLLPPTPLNLWKQSQHTQEDLFNLMHNSSTLQEWSQIINGFLRSVKNKQKYQSYLNSILSYLIGEDAELKENLDCRKQLYKYYKSKLKNSYFVEGDINEHQLQITKQPFQKLFYLYAVENHDQTYFQSAISDNYPEIITQCKQFVDFLIENEAVVHNLQNLRKLVFQQAKFDRMLQKMQKESKLFDEEEYKSFVQSIKRYKNGKTCYLQIIKAFLQYDNADAAISIFTRIVDKGYQLSEEEFVYFLKIKIFALFFYDFGKISLSFKEINDLDILSIVHEFYCQQTIEETPFLQSCFKIYNDKGKHFQSILTSYIFSEKCHFSTMLKIIKMGFWKNQNTQAQLDLFKQKILISKCDIVKNNLLIHQILQKFFSNSKNQHNTIQNILKISEILYFFEVNIQIKQINNILTSPHSNANILILQQTSLRLLKQFIENYLQKAEKNQSKSIRLGKQLIPLDQSESLLKILQYFKENLFKSIIGYSELWQMTFQHLLAYHRYNDINNLLVQDIQNKYSIVYEMIEMLITENIQILLIKYSLREVESDVIAQLKMISLYPFDKVRHNSYLVNLYHYIKILEDKQIQLPQEMKATISLSHLYFLLDHYQDKIDTLNFDQLNNLIYAMSRSNQDETHLQFAVTDDFLKFKVHFVNKAFSLKKNKLANQAMAFIIDQEPPWLATQLVKTCKINNNFDQGFVMVAFNHCAKGQDLQFILPLFEQAKKKVKKESMTSKALNATKVVKMIESTRKFAVITDEIIKDEALYRNHVAEMTFTDEQLNKKQNNLFFTLLGTQPERAFHYALKCKLNACSLITFLHQGMKNNIINSVNVAYLIYKYLYYSLLCQYCHQKITFRRFQQSKIDEFKLSALSQRLDMQAKSSYLYKSLQKMNRTMICLKHLHVEKRNIKFLQTYFERQQFYSILYDDNYRNNSLIELREAPMGRSDIRLLKDLCSELKIDIVELSIFSLANKLNSSDQISEDCENILQKLVTWSQNDDLFAKSILNKLCKKIHATQMLLKTMQNLKQRQNLHLRHLITDYHLQILHSLSALEINRQFYGLIPESFFDKPIGYHPDPNSSLSADHKRILNRAGNKTNIFALSKIMYFIYGMNLQIQRSILDEFAKNNEDMQQIDMLFQKIKKC